jgi:predicted amidohydrolase/streptomycin 6-kinase
MSMLTVGLLQIAAAGNDQAANLARGEAACRRAKQIGADVALFPEMFSVGFAPAVPLDPEAPSVYRSPQRWTAEETPSPPTPAEVWQGLALSTDSPYVRHFRDLARELEMAIALAYLQEWPGLPRNAMSLIDRHGDIVLTYAKVHTCAFSEAEAALTPGDGFPVCVLDTAAGEVVVGAMICYDRVFPESARALMLAGAELILVPNASSMETYRLAQLRSRADENMVALAMANCPGPGQGHSIAFDGIAYTAEATARDMLVVEAGESEGVYPAVFDLDRLRNHRRRETEGDAFRRPALYGALTGTAQRDPFIRIDHQGNPVPGRHTPLASRSHSNPTRPRVDVPERLAASAVAQFGAAGRAWIASLPHLVTDSMDRWSLRPDGPPGHGSIGLVIPVLRNDGTPAALKLQPFDEDSTGAALALRTWDGNGAVRLLEANTDSSIMLLERLNRDRSLASVEDDLAAVHILAELLARLSAVPAPDGLRRLADIAAGMVDQVPHALAQLSDPAERQLVETCAGMVDDVRGEPGDRLLHWDLHYDNVLATLRPDSRQPWLAIDPAPLAGDPAFELLPALGNRWDDLTATGDLRRALLRRFDLMTEVLAMDRQRARAWTAGRVLQNVLWDIDSGQTRLHHRSTDLAQALLTARTTRTPYTGDAARILPYGFDDNDPAARLLRSAPPRQALDWAGQALGGTVESAEPLRGGLSSATHLLRVRRRTRYRAVVLRRYVLPHLQAEQPDIADREARTLSFVESVAVPTPRLLAVDPTGAQAGSPALLMTALPGRVEWVPDDVDPWLRRMAETLPPIHTITPPAPGLVPAYAPDSPRSFDPPPWAHRPHIWERAAEIFHRPAPRDATFIHGDYHPGNLLWHQASVTGVVDWQAGCIGSPSIDVANCRGNLLPYGLDLADRFTSYWEQHSGEEFNPWAGLVGTIAYLDELRKERPPDWQVIEEVLAREVAELDDS